MALDYLITAAGLNTPRLVESRAFCVDLWKSKWGENSHTASDTSNGLIIDCLAIVMDLLWQANGKLWADSFFRTAEGNALDLLLDELAKVRLDARESVASVVWYGSAVTVPDGAATETEQSVRFVVPTGSGAATGGDLVAVVRVETSTDGTYRATINASNFDYVAAGKTIEEIRDGLISAINAGGEPVTASSGGVDPSGFGLVVVDSDDGVTTFTHAASMAAGAGTITSHDGVRIDCEAEVEGPTQALATSLINPTTAISGLEGTTNTLDATLGRLRETDEAFRIRHLQTLQAGGSATRRAIRAHVLLDVDNVDACRVFENVDDVADAAGRPPHSFEVVALGGVDAEIGAVIGEHKPAGIQSVGDIETALTDEEGLAYSVFHSRPASKYAYLEITITQGEGYPTTGDPETAIKAFVAAFFQEGGAGALTMGVDLVRYHVATATGLAVAGIQTCAVRLAVVDVLPGSPVLADADIPIADNEIAVVDSSRIQIYGA